MNASEFQQWLADYCAAFPETAAWINQHGKGVCVKWKSAFDEKAATLSECLAVTRRMVSGDIEAVPAYERATTAARVLRAISEDRQRTRRVAPSEAEDFERIKAENRRGGFPAGAIFRAVKARMESGLSAAEATEEVFRDFGESPEDSKSRRYHCKLCLDESAGLVAVLNLRSLEDIRRVANGGGSPGTAAAACSCKRGQELNRNRKPPTVNFDARIHIPVNCDQQSRAIEIVREFETRNRISAFDDWNERVHQPEFV